MRYGAWLLVLALGCGPDAPPAQRPSAHRPRPASQPVAQPTLAPPPTATPEAATDTIRIIHNKADESFERAKMLYREGSETGSPRALEEAGFAAEDARIKYQVLSDALDSDARAAARDKLVQTNQLLKRIQDARKSAQGPVPAASAIAPPPPPPRPPDPSLPIPIPIPIPPAPAPEAPPEPEPPVPGPEPVKPTDPPSPPRFLALFKDYVGAPDTVKLQPARDAALEAIDSDPDLKPFRQAVATILGRSDRLFAFLRSPERAVFAEILAKHDPATRKPEEIQAALTDIAAARSETGSIRLWGVAYVARAAALGTPDLELMKWLPKLGLISRVSSGSRSIGTREALEMRDLAESAAKGTLDRDIKSARLIKDEDFQAHAALLQLQAWDLNRDVDRKKAQMSELEKHFRTVRVPSPFADLFRHVADTLRRRAPCGPCGATGKLDCPHCEEGRMIGRCPDCNGTGQDRNRRRGSFRCDRCEGTGRVARDRDRCRDCRGQGTVDCTSCDGKPWSPPVLAEFFGQSACPLCSERGFIAAPLWISCEDCLGFGKRPFQP